MAEQGKPQSEQQTKIFEILFNKNEITWQTLLYEAMKNEAMDPWDINVSSLAKQFLKMLKTLKEMDFRISGKVVLAAAILLKLKSSRLVGEDMSELDRLMAGGAEDEYEDFFEEIQNYDKAAQDGEAQPLIPRTPQPRKRKVSIYDLMSALDKALEVRQRRVLRSIPPMKMTMPERKVDISKIISQVYQSILSYFSKNKEKLTFSQLIPSDSKEDKVMTFIPLLHLSNVDQRKIDLIQTEPFGEIEVILYTKQAEAAVTDELAKSRYS